MAKQNEETEKLIKHQLGAKYSNVYYHNDNNDAGNVLVHAQPCNVSAQAQVCAVVGCSMKAEKRCGTQNCRRYLCKNHWVKGGHKAHKALNFKPTSASNGNSSASVTNQSTVETIHAAAVAAAGEEEEDEVEEVEEEEDNVSAVKCQVVECVEEAKHRCSSLNCNFTAICDMHYINQHASHASQLHKDANKRFKIN